MNLVPYTVRLYRSGPKADTFTEEELDRIQQGHLDFVAVAAPVDVRQRAVPATSPTRRYAASGSCVSGIEETLAAVQADPAVVAGRMRAEVFTWLVPEGMLPSETPRLAVCGS